MRKYITNEGSGGQISVDFGREFGTIDIFRILNEIKETETPQIFGTGRGGSISSDVRVRNGVAYFCAADGNFYAVDAETGKELWRFSTGDVLPAFEMDEDTIYASCFDHNLYAITLGGELKWKFATNGKLGNNPCLYAGHVYVGSEDRNLYCLDRYGRLVWKFSTGAAIGAFPAAHKEVIFIDNFDGNLYALDASSGKLLWKFSADGAMAGCMVYDGIVLCPCLNRNLYALSLDGRLLWTYRHSTQIPGGLMSGRHNSMVFIGSRDRNITAISVRDGRKVWEFPTGTMAASYNIVENGILYSGSADSNFYAIDASTGKELWRFTAGGPNIGRGAIWNGKVFFGSWDCNAYCLDAKTGKLIWKFPTSISSMSDYVVDRRVDKEEVIFTLTITEEQAKQERKEDEDLKEYGEFSGSYMAKEGVNYMSSGKKGYIKKRDF